MIVPILLVVGCLALVILEVFVVSFGALTLIAAAMGVAALILAFQESAAFGWTLSAVLFVGVPGALWSAFKLLPKLPFARGLYLARPQLTDDERRAAVRGPIHLLGAVGTAASPLRPAGTVHFDGQPVQAVTGGQMLPVGTRVRVVDVTGNRVIVEEIEETPQPGS